MSAEIITFPRPFQPSREQRREAIIDEMVRILSKCDKRKRGKEALRASLVAKLEETAVALYGRGEG